MAGMDISKLTNAEILTALQNGEITPEEVQGFSKSEQVALTQGLAGENETVIGDSLILTTNNITPIPDSNQVQTKSLTSKENPGILPTHSKRYNKQYGSGEYAIVDFIDNKRVKSTRYDKNDNVIAVRTYNENGGIIETSQKGEINFVRDEFGRYLYEKVDMRPCSYNVIKESEYEYYDEEVDRRYIETDYLGDEYLNIHGRLKHISKEKTTYYNKQDGQKFLTREEIFAKKPTWAIFFKDRTDYFRKTKKCIIKTYDKNGSCNAKFVIRGCSWSYNVLSDGEIDFPLSDDVQAKLQKYAR